MPNASYAAPASFYFADLIPSPQSGLLGDSAFPELMLAHLDHRKIELFQSLYKQYCALNFTNVTDRSVAISGLEQRLQQTFDCRGRFGIFEKFLPDSLLWQRHSSSQLIPIEYPRTRPIPSWSWMAYAGPISYVEVDFSLVDWCHSSVKLMVMPQNGSSGLIKGFLASTSRALISAPSELVDGIRFDQQIGKTWHDPRCIVLAKDAQRHAESKHYVLVIAKEFEEGIFFKRVGAGWLLEQNMASEQIDVMVE